jgi:hypothetical protein
MRYKPNFCCHCGEKIERPNPSFTDSKMFCDVCKHDFVPTRIFPILAGGLLAIIGVFGIGSYWRGAGKPVQISTVQAMGNPSGPDKIVANSPSPQSSNSNAAPISPPSNVRASAPAARTKTDNPVAGKNDSWRASAIEAVYFCGAATKKGTPCSRRVRGGGRCWQHKGLAAMLPDEKLLASQ